MNTFNYQDIDTGNIKNYFLNAFKLFLRRPLFSFLPFVLLFSISFFMLKSNILFSGVAFFYLFIELLFPIIGTEMSYANDYSKKPFSKISYIHEFKTNPFYKEIMLRIGRVFLCFLVFYSILMLMPLEPASTQVASETKNNQELSSYFFFIISSISFVLSFILILIYISLFEISLILVPALINDIPQNEKLLNLRNQAFFKNKNTFLKILAPIGFLQVFIPLILLQYSLLLSLGVFFFILGIGVSLSYIIVKDMSGGGTKIKEKKSIFNKKSSKQNVLSESH